MFSFFVNDSSSPRDGPQQKSQQNLQSIVSNSDHVSYRGARPMHRSIYRVSILGRVSTDVSTDTPIGRYTWWFTETSPILYLYFTDTLLILRRYYTDASPILYFRRVYWLISVDISVDTLVDTRPILDRSINALICRYNGRYIGR